MLSTGVALSVMALAVGNTSAWAASTEICGAVTDGQVVCSGTPDNYANGIKYELDAPSGDLTLTVTAPVQANGVGVAGVNPFGSLTIDTSATSVSTEGEAAFGVLAISGFNMTVNAGTISTSGLLAHGAVVYADAGDASIVADTVITAGQGSIGISAVSQHGDVNVKAGTIETHALDSTGIKTIGYEGDINIDVGTLLTFNYQSTGIQAISIADTGTTNINFGELGTYDEFSTGVYVDAVNAVNISGQSLYTVGNGSTGIMAFTQSGPLNIDVDSVETFGQGSVGVVAESETGDITVNLKDLYTLGDAAGGLFADTITGNLTLNIDAVRTDGYGADGVIGFSVLGQTSATIGKAETTREFSTAVYLAGGTGLTAGISSVQTAGFGSTGLNLVTGNYNEDYYTEGHADVSVQSVETRGAESVGVALTLIGTSDLKLGSIRTFGDKSIGFLGFAERGDIKATIGSIHTSGEEAYGIHAESMGGNVTLDVGAITTDGNYSHGLMAFTDFGNVDIKITGDIVTKGDVSNGIVSSSLLGNTNIVSQKSITANGIGILAAASGNITISAAEITTTGAQSRGIEAFASGDTNDRDITVTAGKITTSGAFSHGILARNPDFGIISRAPDVADDGADEGVFSRNIVVRADNVAVTGEGSAGIFAEGVADVSVEAGNVSAKQAQALWIDARHQATVLIKGAVTSDSAEAAAIKGENVTLTLVKGGSVAAAGDSVVLSAVGPYVPSDDGGWGGIGLFAATSPGLATVENAGLIRSTGGAAIRVNSGTATIKNSGQIEGALILADGDDTVTNSGTVIVTSDSDFGAGTDVFANTGVVKFGASTLPISASFLGLESFTNDGGLIDLRNDRAGDIFTLSGAYAGKGDARLALDVAGATADTLVVAGAATGKTSIVLQGVGAGKAGLLDKGVRLVTTGAGSSADAFVLANAEQGLVRYGLTFDKASNGYVLSSAAGTASYQVLQAGNSLQTAWRTSADAFASDQAWDRMAKTEARQVWVQTHAASLDSQSHTDGGAFDVSDSWTGGQMGATLTSRGFAQGRVTFGVTGGAMNATTKIADNAETIDVQTLNAGLYATWASERLFASGLVKYDRHDIHIRNGQAAIDAKVDGSTVGAQLQAGYRAQLGKITLEPLIGLDYVNVSIHDLTLQNQTITFEDHKGWSGRASVRASTTYSVAGGRTVRLLAGLDAIHDFDPDQTGALSSNGLSDAVTLSGAETYGRATVGANLDITTSVSAYVQAEGRFGDGYKGGQLSVGARYRF